MIYLGNFAASSMIYFPFDTYGASGESITMSGLAVTDIEIYKNGGTTQRASDNGYALLDTDGIDFDGVTGLHGFSIDLSDNSDSGFYAAGSVYWVNVNAITINSQTVRFTFYFTIGVLPANVTQWLGTACATPTVAGVPEVDLTHIDGLATSSNLATLNLKQLNISNSAGSAIVAASTGSNGHGMTLTGNGAGDGLVATGGSSGGDGATFTGGASNGRGFVMSASGTAPAMSITNSSSGRGVLVQSLTGLGIEIQALADSAVSLIGTGSGNFCIECSPATSATDSNLLVQATDSSGNDLVSLDGTDAIETGLTFRGLMRLLGAAIAGKLSGADGTTVTIRNAVADSKVRITATVDASGNRSAVTTDQT